MKLILVGGDKATYYLAQTFAAKGHRVVLVNKDRDYCEELSEKLKALVVCGDGSQPSVLEDAGSRSADALLALTPDDPANLLICQLAREVFSVPRTFSIINNPTNEKIFKELGVEQVFNKTTLLSELVEQKVTSENIDTILSLAGGRVNVTQVVLTDDSPATNQKLEELALPPDSVIGTVIRDEGIIVPRGDTKLQADDELLVFTLNTNQGEVLEALVGSKL